MCLNQHLKIARINTGVTPNHCRFLFTQLFNSGMKQQHYLNYKIFDNKKLIYIKKSLTST